MYLLHISYATGKTSTETFVTRFDRALFIIALRNQPVKLALEDPAVAA